MSDISITYDLLFDVLKIEKSREELQRLDEKFYKNVVDYILTKESAINNPNTPLREKELTRIQLGNVRKLLMELYDRREKKILNLAIYKVKTSAGMINTDALLDEEKNFFDAIYSQLSLYRSSIINNVIDGKATVVPAVDSYPASGSLQAKSGMNKMIDDAEDESDGVISVRFIKPVPKFLGSELETYGPFEEDDIASLPSKIANILVRKFRAEEIHIN